MHHQRMPMFFFPILFVNEEQAQISWRRGPPGSTDIPSAAESFHVGRDTASEVWVSLGFDCWGAETEMKIITDQIIFDMLSTGFAQFTLFSPTLKALSPLKFAVF